MWPYYYLLLVPIVAIIALEINARFKAQSNVVKERNNYVMPLFFIALFALLVCRGESVGIDLPGYHYWFDSVSQWRLSEVFSSWNQCLFYFLNYLVGQFTDNFHWYLAIVAVIEILPLAYVYCQERKNDYLKIVLFINLTTFQMLFSGIRQAMAISLGVWAFDFIRRDKKIAFVVVALIASLIHHSGFMVFLIWPLYRMRLQRKHMYVIVPAFLAVLALNGSIFGFLAGILAETNENTDAYLTEMKSTGAFMSLVLYALFAAFAYIVSDENRIDEETCGLRNILLFTVLLQCFAPIHELAMRMNLYFIIFTPLAIAKCVAVPKPGLAKFALYGKFVLCAFFTYYYCSNIYSGYWTTMKNGQTSAIMLGAMPYVPFWSN